VRTSGREPDSGRGGRRQPGLIARLLPGGLRLLSDLTASASRLAIRPSGRWLLLRAPLEAAPRLLGHRPGAFAGWVVRRWLTPPSGATSANWPGLPRLAFRRAQPLRGVAAKVARSWTLTIRVPPQAPTADLEPGEALPAEAAPLLDAGPTTDQPVAPALAELGAEAEPAVAAVPDEVDSPATVPVAARAGEEVDPTSVARIGGAPGPPGRAKPPRVRAGSGRRDLGLAPPAGLGEPGPRPAMAAHQLAAWLAARWSRLAPSVHRPSMSVLSGRQAAGRVAGRTQPGAAGLGLANVAPLGRSAGGLAPGSAALPPGVALVRRRAELAAPVNPASIEALSRSPAGQTALRAGPRRELRGSTETAVRRRATSVTATSVSAAADWAPAAAGEPELPGAVQPAGGAVPAVRPALSPTAPTPEATRADALQLAARPAAAGSHSGSLSIATAAGFGRAPMAVLSRLPSGRTIVAPALVTLVGRRGRLAAPASAERRELTALGSPVTMTLASGLPSLSRRSGAATAGWARPSTTAASATIARPALGQKPERPASMGSGSPPVDAGEESAPIASAAVALEQAAAGGAEGRRALAAGSEMGRTGMPPPAGAAESPGVALSTPILAGRVDTTAARQWPVLRALLRPAAVARSVTGSALRLLSPRMAVARRAVTEALAGLPALGPGEALPPAVRAPMETFVSRDLARVRLYVSPIAEVLGAAAFATGERLVFAPGRLDTRSPAGLALIGHELTHVGAELAFRRFPGEGEADEPEERAAEEQAALIQRIAEQGWPSSPRMDVRRAPAPTPVASIQPYSGSAASGSLDAPAIQRVVAATSGAGGEGGVTPSARFSQPATDEPGQGPAAPDVNALARQVYDILKVRLRAESERRQVYGR